MTQIGIGRFYCIIVLALMAPSKFFLEEASAFSSSVGKFEPWRPMRGTQILNQQRYRSLSSLVYNRKRKQRNKSKLYHTGHVHTHHDHNHYSSSEILNPRQRNRKIVMWLSCWVITCGRSLLKKRRVLKGDVMVFLIMSFVLMFADKIHRSTKNSIQKLNNFRQKIINSERTLSQLHKEDTREADRVTWMGVAVNLLLSIGKLGVGVTQHSSVLIADAGHSLSDLVSDFITLWSVQIARLPADDDHPYGHDKFEAIGSLFLSLTLLATGLSVGAVSKNQLLQLWSTQNSAVASIVRIPGPLALLMAGVSIASKEWLYRITKVVGEKLNSSVVIANAWHHRSDAYSSVLALLSIAGAMVGFPSADAAAGLLIAGMICTTGTDVLVESVQQLSDSAHKGMQSQIRDVTNKLVAKDCDVIEVTSIRARQVGSSSFCDVVLKTPPNLSMTAAQAIEDRWNKWITHSLKESKGCGSCLTVSVSAKPNMVSNPTTNKTRKRESFSCPSAGLIELLTRQQALLLAPELHHYPKIQSVTVHFGSSGQTIVDVKVKMTGTKSLTVVEDDAKALKIGLEKLQEIDKAHIYLDLLSNEDENKEVEMVPLGGPYLSALTPELHSMIFQAESHSHEVNYRGGLFGKVNAMNNTAVGV